MSAAQVNHCTNSMGEVTTHQRDDVLDIDDAFVDG
jgi:hypothetical protein